MQIVQRCAGRNAHRVLQNHGALLKRFCLWCIRFGRGALWFGFRWRIGLRVIRYVQIALVPKIQRSPEPHRSVAKRIPDDLFFPIAGVAAGLTDCVSVTQPGHATDRQANPKTARLVKRRKPVSIKRRRLP